ncbi:MAG: hypothetical protein GY757_34400 [bacterium]|nr:hypothetical protein [bacterium]
MEAVSVNDQKVRDIKNLSPIKGAKDVAFQFTVPTFITPGSTRFRVTARQSVRDMEYDGCFYGR